MRNGAEIENFRKIGRLVSGPNFGPKPPSIVLSEQMPRVSKKHDW